MKASRLGDLRNGNDPLLTFEGDNNVLLQQTSNHLITGYEEYLKTKSVPDTPLQTLEFLNRFEQTNTMKFAANNRAELCNQQSKYFIWIHLLLSGTSRLPSKARKSSI